MKDSEQMRAENQAAGERGWTEDEIAAAEQAEAADRYAEVYAYDSTKHEDCITLWRGRDGDLYATTQAGTFSIAENPHSDHFPYEVTGTGHLVTAHKQAANFDGALRIVRDQTKAALEGRIA